LGIETNGHRRRITGLLSQNQEQEPPSSARGLNITRQSGTWKHKHPKEEGQKFVSSGFSLIFQQFSFILHLLMDLFPSVFDLPFEPVDLCFEDSDEGFLSHCVESVSDRAFYALPVRDVVFGEFLFDMTKKEEVTWFEVRAISRARHPLDCFA
jgi:hypothetical protein